MTTDDEIPRWATAVVTERLQWDPVVFLAGPRSSGKSTVMRAIARERGVAVVDLDDDAVRRAVAADPALVLVGGEDLVCIDEVQRAPEVLQAIKAELNARSAPGRFLLTGSTSFASWPQATQALTGRIALVDLWPLAQAERSGQVPDLIDLAFADVSALRGWASREARAAIHDRVLAGGLPLALARPAGRARSDWFGDYLSAVLARDVPEVRDVRRHRDLPLLTRALVARTGQVVNSADLGRELGLDRGLVADWVSVLAAVHLVSELPSWGRTLTSRVGRKPKVHVVDSGLGAHLLRITAARLGAADPAALTEFGHLLESFVVGEVRRQLPLSSRRVDVGHFRSSDGAEVDLVLEDDRGDVVGIEVKASSRVTASDARGLRLLRDRLGSRWRAGLVVAPVPIAARLDEGIFAVPLDVLWNRIGVRRDDALRRGRAVRPPGGGSYTLLPADH